MNLQQYLGKKVMLVPISEKYREDIFAASTPTLVRFMSWSAPIDISETDTFIKNAIKDSLTGKTHTFTVTDLVSGQFIGICSIHEDIPGKKEVGIWIKESVQGNGYGKDTLQTLLLFAREKLQLDSLLYRVAPENIGSQKLCESIGGVKIGTSMIKHKSKSMEIPMIDYLITL